MTNYVVTGRHRTGTSMMMRAIASSSNIPTYVDLNIDADIDANIVKDIADYHPNPNGYYQPPFDHRLGDQPGHLVKVGLATLQFEMAPIGHYLIIRMVRDETARLASWDKAFKHPESENAPALYDRTEAYLQTRPDFKLTIMAYEELMAHPLREFSRIADAGWPIDIEKAAYTVDKNLYRHKAP